MVSMVKGLAAAYRPWEEPGAAGVTFLPKMIEHPEPGG